MSAAWRRRLLFLTAFLLILWVVWDINQQETDQQVASKSSKDGNVVSSPKRSPSARPDQAVRYDAGSLRIPSRQEYIAPVPDLFEIPKPPEPMQVAKAPEVPVAPPLPFVYLGRFEEGNKKQIFLADGNATLAVGAGARLSGGWILESIETGNLVFLYEPLGQKQLLQIREF